MLGFLCFVLNVTVAVSAVVGFIVMLSKVVEYLDDRDSFMVPGRVVGVGRAGEDRIDDLRDAAIGDMFDVARRVRLEAHVGVDDEGGVL